jgi:nuclear pore complex protein Nup50
MSTKRSAGTELNHDNWNDDEELEDAGIFKKASDDVIQKRVRKVAKRRVIGASDDNDGKSKNPFNSFGGFSSGTLTASTPAVNTASAFAFLSNLQSAPAKSPESTTNNINFLTNKNGGTECKSSLNEDYLSKVKSLNQAFYEWIKKHFEENALYDFTPTFKDYEKYMKEFEALKRHQKPAEKLASEQTKKDSPAKIAAASNFTFGLPASTVSPQSSITTGINSSVFASAVNSSNIFSAASKIDTEKKEVSPLKPSSNSAENKSGFSFGLNASTNASSAPTFSFGLQKTSTAVPTFGNFGGTPSFSFGNVTQVAKSTEGSGNTEEEENEEPPKNEFVPVVEDDSLFSKRCKVFVKSGADYADRGVGTLFLKKVDEKVQLIVRADTNLGNILLNIIITDGLPTSRLGKNNVMIVCVPTPESKPPPTSVLVRVKTGEEADELLATIDKYKS